MQLGGSDRVLLVTRSLAGDAVPTLEPAEHLPSAVPDRKQEYDYVVVHDERRLVFRDFDEVAGSDHRGCAR